MDRVERCEKKFGELFGGKPVQREGTDAEFMRILQRFIFGEVSYTGSLDDRMRELVTVTVLTVNQTYPQLTAHVGACLRVGVRPETIREVVYQCAPFIGFPKVLNAIAAMNEAFVKAGVALPLPEAETVAEEGRFAAGLALQKPVYGDEIKDRYAWLPGDFAEAIPRFLTELCFADFSTRRNLGEKERELLTVVILAALGGAEVQVRSHVAGALKVGNSKEEIVCALVHAMPYMGGPRLFNALNCGKDLLSGKEESMDANAFEKANVFGLGQENSAYAQYFVGKSYLNPLTPAGVAPFFANVTFEPGCRNNWHVHLAKSGGGQILLCVAGSGWYQEWGKPARSLAPGDVVVIPAGVKHWHGAKKDSWFSHIAVEVPGEDCSNEWLEPVSNEQYSAL